MENLIEVNDLHFSYGPRKVLQGINLGVTKLITGAVSSPNVSRLDGFSSARAVFASDVDLAKAGYWQQVVAGVRDYGNRMGIPTVNGALCFDPRYLGNPLVYCGTVGVLPADKSFKAARPGDLLLLHAGDYGAAAVGV